ncbi:MAG TPA: hypothetical protein VK430_00645 [Xanthobacteraceae bacterium]|nr:hypothetical protein [Xanthobacteraceae bacterium]
MTCNGELGLVKACGLLVGFVLMVLAVPAWAADPVFPPGSRIGLVPPTGMVASNAFAGFTDPDKNAAILIATLPAAAYSQLEKTLDVAELRKQGLTLEKRESMQLRIGKAFLFTGRQVADKERYRKWLLVAAAGDFTALVSVQIPENDTAYPDSVVRAALATLSMRPTVPENEQLGLLPFAVGDLAGFHIDAVLPGRALVLSDVSSEAAKDASTPAPAGDLSLDARFLIAAVPGGPAEASEHATFARLSFNEIGGIRNIRITMSEPLRISGQSGYQTMAEAKDARTGADVMVVQWLRFGSGGFLQMVGVVRADVWTKVLARLRAVRDSIELK